MDEKHEIFLCEDTIYNLLLYSIIFYGNVPNPPN